MPLRFIGLVLLVVSAAGVAVAKGAGIAHDDSARLASWCQAQPGMPRQQLLDLMGPATTALPTQLSWRGSAVLFNAFLGADGTARQLDINVFALSDADRASLPCSSTRTRRSVAAALAAATAPAKPARVSRPACELVTAAEMSAILGIRVTAEAHERSRSSTQCIYKPDSGSFRSVDLSINWGDGRAGMAGMGLAGKHESGMVSTYDGLGDQAGRAGPLLMIRTGEDLVNIVFSGVTNDESVARKIFATAKPRM